MFKSEGWLFNFDLLGGQTWANRSSWQWQPGRPNANDPSDPPFPLAAARTVEQTLEATVVTVATRAYTPIQEQTLAATSSSFSITDVHRNVFTVCIATLTAQQILPGNYETLAAEASTTAGLQFPPRLSAAQGTTGGTAYHLPIVHKTQDAQAGTTSAVAKAIFTPKLSAVVGTVAGVASKHVTQHLVALAATVASLAQRMAGLTLNAVAGSTEGLAAVLRTPHLDAQVTTTAGLAVLSSVAPPAVEPIEPVHGAILFGEPQEYRPPRAQRPIYSASVRAVSSASTVRARAFLRMGVVIQETGVDVSVRILDVADSESSRASLIFSSKTFAASSPSGTRAKGFRDDVVALIVAGAL